MVVPGSRVKVLVYELYLGRYNENTMEHYCPVFLAQVLSNNKVTPKQYTNSLYTTM